MYFDWEEFFWNIGDVTKKAYELDGKTAIAVRENTK
jgi:hypothetical protein